jgi:ankyrin repeat protein
MVDKMEYDVNQQTFDGVTALQFALDNNHAEVVEVLLMHQDLANERLREMDNP